ncbi:hypothetical protein Egran_02296 [Elaphomyces granulatus]|uniref:HNH nuclease domain-containing protein n=1 Tax=Elaphomyces granulatus TaxID=519963 RepID=A0A232M0K1_9EURO|nr:hypothetical protein Egran_02296 [Elaphomyces granulatus]
MLNPPVIPERMSSLLPEARRIKLRENRQRHASYASAASTTISEFLEEKILSCELDMEYLKSYKGGLQQANPTDAISKEDIDEEVGKILNRFEPLYEEVKILKRQRKYIIEDLEVDMSDLKKQKQDKDVDVALLERAYTNTIVPRVMAASGKQRKGSFKQSNFRKAVLNFYNAADNDSAYCHLTGWWQSKDVRAAHLVPKSLTSEEVSYLFGGLEAVEYMPQNTPRKSPKRRIGRSPSLRATLREQLKGVQFLKPSYADTTKVNIAGMLRNGNGFEVLRVQPIRRILEGCDRKSRS